MGPIPVQDPPSSTRHYVRASGAGRRRWCARPDGVAPSYTMTATSPRRNHTLHRPCVALAAVAIHLHNRLVFTQLVAPPPPTHTPRLHQACRVRPHHTPPPPSSVAPSARPQTLCLQSASSPVWQVFLHQAHFMKVGRPCDTLDRHMNGKSSWNLNRHAVRH